MAEAENKPKRTPRKSSSTPPIAPVEAPVSDAPPAKPARKTTTASKTPRRTSTSTRAKAAPKADEIAVEVAPVPELPWYRMDLHIHTPASHDYEQPEMGYMAILRQAEKRGLSIIAFTDHNTVYGYRNMRREIADLEMLERLERIRPNELGKLTEYRRLLKKILVLPGFEFTATFGFHILGIFPPEKPIRDIESILMQLRVPGQALDLGLSEAGATSDVLTAYRTIADGGGLAIAAHANSTNGVSMRDMDFGGQTRIAYTQDQYLHAIEWTDLDRGRRSSSTLLTGIRQEYSRRMHALQASDAHRITVSPANPKRLGIGERPTEVKLAEVSFVGLKSLLQSSDWDRVRPAFNILDVPTEIETVVAEPSESATQAYHVALGKKATDRFDAIITDICAMLNGSGGAIVVGAEAPIVVPETPAKPNKTTKTTKTAAAKVAPKRKMPGVKSADAVAEELGEAIQSQIYPAPQSVTIMEDVLGEVSILRVSIAASKLSPHVIDEVCYLRDNTESRVATRDELVAMIKRVLEVEMAANRSQLAAPVAAPAQTSHSRSAHAPSHRNSSPVGNAPVMRNQNAPAPAPRQPAYAPPRNPRDAQFSQPAAPVINAPRDNGNGRPQRQPMPSRRRDDVSVMPMTDNRDDVNAVAVMPVMNAGNEIVGMPPPEAAVSINQNASNDNAPEVQPIIIARAAQMIIAPIVAPREVLPKSGVEIALMEEREDMNYYAVRDMRNGGVTRNVTLKSARDLWHYAILKYTSGAYDVDKIAWQGDRAVLGRAERAGKVRYDLALRTTDGLIHVFFGVVMDGLDATWKSLMSAQNAAFENERLGDSDSSDDAPIEVISTEIENIDIAPAATSESAE